MSPRNARGVGPRGERLEGPELARRLHSTAIQLLRRVRRTDAAMGLSSARASVLSVLVFGGPRSIGQLAEEEQVRAPTMTRLVAGLEADGHVRRTADPRDGRSVIVRATARGRRLLERGRKLRLAQIEGMLSGLTASEAALLSDAVKLLERTLTSPVRRRDPV